MKYDYIIVGQGIAGSMIAWFLLKHNKKILVIDKFNPNSSSNIAAGVINPVTGRKMVKTWMIDEVLPFAKKTYREIEQELAVSFFFEQDIYKIFTSEADEQTWKKKKDEADYRNYLGDVVDMQDECLYANNKAGIIKQSCWMDVPVFIKAFRNYLAEKAILLDTDFEYDRLQIGDILFYKNSTADKIIFCEGYKAIDNPFFKNIPFTLAKGEQLLVHAPMLSVDKIINRNVFLIPKKHHNYSIGATYSWDDLTESVTQDGRNELTAKLEKLISCRYEIIEEKAAIRPTTVDRRPVIDRHSVHKNVFIFNGMGTKGVSLAPYLAAHLTDAITYNKPIMEEITLDRFKDK